MRAITLLFLGWLLALRLATADVGDPQIRTDHPWYPGELACSSFDRLFKTQAELYERVVGTAPASDEQKALASWFWRNTHYAHGEEGAEDLWSAGFTKGGDVRTRDYWTGLFAHGFGLCGTTHSQWTAEMEYLLGHNRGRGVGVEGHNSFEVFLNGAAYGGGKWVLLDHDISTVIYNEEGTALLSIPEVKADLKRLIKPAWHPEKQHGWMVCGLHPDDGGVYAQYSVAEYFAGYAGAPPMVHLRRGETLRRFLQPGLEDGTTFVNWGRNYNAGGIPGPERSRTWVNQPEKMYQSKSGTGFKTGQMRYANALYHYEPNFSNGDYKEGLVQESASQVVFEFYTPYIIGATPATPGAWDIYKPGGRNGLVLRGKAACPVAISVDAGKSWQECGAFSDGMDLTDFVKGRRQYLIRFAQGAKELAGSGLSMTTVCQANVAVLPRLKDNGAKVYFESSGQAVVSAGPNREQAAAKIVAGAFQSPTVTMELSSPRQEPVVGLYAAGHVGSGSPPNPEVKYQIEFSTDRGATWQALLKDWSIPRRGNEPGDFWSQSFCYGATNFPAVTGPVQVRFRNDGGKRYQRAEVHLVYKTPGADATKVTVDWSDSTGSHRESHSFKASDKAPWEIKTAEKVNTHWVEFAVE